MLEFLGTAFSIVLALVVFGLILAIVVYGFRASERAVKNHDRDKGAREGVRAEAASAQTR